MGKGFLQVAVHAGNEAFPVAAAQVTIEDITGNVLYQLTTDINGKTQAVELAAPNKETTLDPKYQGLPYAKYDILVSHPGFFPTEISHVQVFDTITSTLPVNLLPAPKTLAKQNVINHVVIGDSPLLSSKERIMPEATNLPTPKVLREVVLPEYVTVHLGAPTASARNVRVKYMDYLKNVASSEIYPTWPVAALEANIYAQISFFLNRIFTEWYRSRGYNFDITNSTAFDQCFVEGRNIFDSVSAVVDRIFNQYIRRKGRLEPLHARYCNGTTSTCAGLSQWGTVPLANQGRTAFEILRNFYPSDIEIVTTNNFSNQLESFPGVNLQQGSSSEDVKKMQLYLNRIRTNYPGLPLVRTDGLFDATMTQAVKLFQSVFSLQQTGVINKATWNQITRIYVAVTKLGELTSEGHWIGIGDNPPTSVLRLNSKGADVAQLQFILNYLSIFFPSIPPVIQNGTFDKTTEASVIEFQKNYNLKADGIVGPATWALLYQTFRSAEDVGAPEKPQPPGPPGPGPSPSYPPYPGVALRNGSRGDSVRYLQESLNVIGTKHTTIPRLSTDGVFGNNTQQAVIRFQTIFGLTADGIVGPITWNKMIEIRKGIEEGKPVITHRPYPGTVLQSGSRGENVRYLQESLNVISTVHSNIPKLVADGIFGNATLGAVRAFQAAYGLAVDGRVGPLTWNKVMQIRGSVENA